ncbi:hypothetical protein ACWD0G_26090, partial [Streptomyces goshikiensis]
MIFDDNPTLGARPLTQEKLQAAMSERPHRSDEAPAANSQAGPSAHDGPHHSYPPAPESRFNPVVRKRWPQTAEPPLPG